MSSILSYSGISAKVSAMNGKLIKPAQYEQLIHCSTVGDAVGYLKQLPAYESALRDFDEGSSHRGSIEEMLTSSLYHDFNRLYLFANPEQKRFLDLHRMHFEVTFLKDCLHSAFAGTGILRKPAYYREFFIHRSRLRYDALVASRSIDEFIQALSNTDFYAPLERIRKSQYNSLFDYEIGFDQFYFCYLWKVKDKLLSGKELEIITDNYGTRIDLLNIQWIMRARQFYRMSNAELYTMIIPCYYRIKPRDISSMVEAAKKEDFAAAVANTYYGRKYASQIGQIQSVEKMYVMLLERIYELTGRRHPYSIAPINAYLYNKELEIRRITSIIEGIRYGLPKRELAAYIQQKQMKMGGKNQ